MNTETQKSILKAKIEKDFNANKSLIFKNGSAFMNDIRSKAFEKFCTLGFPHTKMEEWRFTNLAPVLSKDYSQHFTPPDSLFDLEKVFRCEVQDLDTYTVTQLNNWYAEKHIPLCHLPNGVIIGSLAKAMEAHPDIIEKHFSKYAAFEDNGITALNTAFAQDGVFIYIPDGVEMDKPIQIISIIDAEENMLVQPRNLIILGKNSKLSLVHCDHTIKHKSTLINTVSEIFLDEGSVMDHYKMQNKDNNSALIATTCFHQEANSQLTTNTIVLNGGLVRNNLNIKLNGRGSHADLYGLYLVDKTQHMDNTTFVDHVAPDTTSNELYKGIVDDKAHAVFSGKILVRRDAQKVNAFQSNKNLLLTDEATVNTKPHLEIYADDVKCSHGATVGQMNPDEMFYLRSRGISEENARMLLMYAFADEIVTKISVEALRERVCQLVSKRLKGELSICDQCVLHCNENKLPEFEIDMSKI
jgi:Fe-S cluster assembly protein SufD